MTNTVAKSLKNRLSGAGEALLYQIKNENVLDHVVLFERL